VIGRLTGRIVERGLDGVAVLDVGGVGYDVLVPLGTLGRLPASEPVTLHVHTHVREDALQLYGFATLDDRAAFRTLLSVSSIGPKVAHTILSHLDARALASAIARGDQKTLTSVPGVGKKLAERILLELKDKLGFTHAGAPQTMTAAGPVPALPIGPLAETSTLLVSLGFKPAEADRALAVVAKSSEGKSVETLLKEALAVLG
jgi:Holliday junction DNA helicase RuvA